MVEKSESDYLNDTEAPANPREDAIPAHDCAVHPRFQTIQVRFHRDAEHREERNCKNHNFRERTCIRLEQKLSFLHLSHQILIQNVGSNS